MGTGTVDKLTKLVAMHQQVQTSLIQLEEELNDYEIAARLRSLGKSIRTPSLLLGPWPFHLEDKALEIHRQLRRHFATEEDMLDECCDLSNHPYLVSALHQQHWDHQELLSRMELVGSQVRELVNIPLSDRDRCALTTSSELRQCISGLCVLLEEHAHEERLLFRDLRLRLSSESLSV